MYNFSIGSAQNKNQYDQNSYQKNQNTNRQASQSSSNTQDSVNNPYALPQQYQTNQHNNQNSFDYSKQSNLNNPDYQQRNVGIPFYENQGQFSKNGTQMQQVPQQSFPQAQNQMLKQNLQYNFANQPQNWNEKNQEEQKQNPQSQQGLGYQNNQEWQNQQFQNNQNQRIPQYQFQLKQGNGTNQNVDNLNQQQQQHPFSQKQSFQNNKQSRNSFEQISGMQKQNYRFSTLQLDNYNQYQDYPYAQTTKSQKTCNFKHQTSADEGINQQQNPNKQQLHPIYPWNNKQEQFKPQQKQIQNQFQITSDGDSQNYQQKQNQQKQESQNLSENKSYQNNNNQQRQNPNDIQNNMFKIIDQGELLHNIDMPGQYSQQQNKPEQKQIQNQFQVTSDGDSQSYQQKSNQQRQESQNFSQNKSQQENNNQQRQNQNDHQNNMFKITDQGESLHDIPQQKQQFGNQNEIEKHQQMQNYQNEHNSQQNENNQLYNQFKITPQDDDAYNNQQNQQQGFQKVTQQLNIINENQYKIEQEKRKKILKQRSKLYPFVTKQEQEQINNELHLKSIENTKNIKNGQFTNNNSQKQKQEPQTEDKYLLQTYIDQNNDIATQDEFNQVIHTLSILFQSNKPIFKNIITLLILKKIFDDFIKNEYEQLQSDEFIESQLTLFEFYKYIIDYGEPVIQNENINILGINLQTQLNQMESVDFTFQERIFQAIQELNELGELLLVNQAMQNSKFQL